MHFNRFTIKISTYIYIRCLNEKKPSFEHLIKRIQQNKHLTYKYPWSYYRILEQQFKHRQLPDKSLVMRRRILKNQRSHNFQNEYDKIKAMLFLVITPKGLNPEYYENRIKYLEKMGASAVEGIK